MEREKTKQPELKDVAGPWVFVTRKQFEQDGKALIWRSRAHRKSLGPSLPIVAAPDLNLRSLNPWIAAGFGIGSLMFIIGSVLSLWPGLTALLAISEAQVGATYFAGSIFFTLAAYLQLLQAANAGLRLPGAPPPKAGIVWVGWQLRNIGWLSSALQFVGTVLFNINTFMAMGLITHWLWLDITVWLPDLLGSILFLLSGYLAFIEVCDGYWAWRWRDLSWWVVWVNLLGCVAFMISALYAFVPPGGAAQASIVLSIVWTLIGAVGFMAGAYLMLAEHKVYGLAAEKAG